MPTSKLLKTSEIYETSEVFPGSFNPKETRMTEKEMAFSESVEDYLETILDLEKTNKVARAKDIAKRMGFRQGSVTGALKNMAEKGLINYEPYSFITLTRKGTKIAREITRRHTVLKDFLFRVLQLDVKKADAVACRMEHDIDKASVDKLVQFIDFIDTCPRAGADWMAMFMDFCSTRTHDWEKCEICLEHCKARHQKNKA